MGRLNTEHLLDNPLGRIDSLETRVESLERTALTDVTAVGGVTDHGSLDGLEDDDHSQYIPRDGSRDFTSPVEGRDPTDPQHLTTKSYVDATMDRIEVDQIICTYLSAVAADMGTLNAGQIQLLESGTLGTDATGTVLDADGLSYGGDTWHVAVLDSGAIKAGFSTSGTFLAQAGEIGGWDIGERTLEADSGAVGMNSEATAGTDWRFWAGNATPGSAPFRVDESGNLVATSATITGSITATTGTIGGWAITADVLHNANDIALDAASKSIWVNDETFGNTGIQIEYNAGWPRAYIGDGSNAYLNFDGTKLTWKGANTELDGSGNLTCTGGTIGGWAISDTEIKNGTDIVLDSSVPKIEIGGSGYIRSNNYASGYDGFYIDDDYAEFGNAFIRGELHCAVFVRDLISAHAGTLLVAKSAGKLAEDFAVDAGLSQDDANTDNLVVEDPPTGGWLFDDNDIIRIREEYAGGVHETWIKVTQTGATNEYSTTYQSGGLDVTYHQGTVGVDYGASGDGGVMTTGDLANAPYTSAFTHAGSPWSTMTEHTRVGNLSGVLGLSADEYGIAAGEDLGDASKAHSIFSDSQATLKGIAQEWWRGDGTKMAELDPTASGSGTLFGAGPDVDSDDYQFTISAEGDVWLSNLALSSTLAEQFFTANDGLLLLGPNCPITATSWETLRGQKATISGPPAPHLVAGEWAGTKALVVEAGTKNEIKNPIFENNVTDSWSTFGASPSRSTARAFIGSASCEQVADSGGGNAGQKSNSFTLSDGSSVYAKARAWRNDDSINGRLQIRDLTNGNATNVGLSEANKWEEVTASWRNNTGGAVSVEIRLLNVEGDGSSKIWWDAVQAEIAADSSFCCGYLDWCSWDGTAHNSTSTRQTTNLDLDSYAGLFDGNSTFTLHCLVQAPADYGDLSTFPGTTPYIAHACFTGNYAYYIRHDFFGTDEIIAYAISGSGNSTILHGGSASQFSAGDWIWIELAVDTANNEQYLYINGELADSSTVSMTDPPADGFNQWKIGSDRDGNNVGGWTVAEVALFDTALTAEQVAALYQRDQPLVDTGAYDAPGIYILDGRFSLASSMTGARTRMDESGWFAYDAGGDAAFGLALEDGVSWGGFTINKADLVLGHNKSGSAAIKWDQSTGKFEFYGGGGATPEAYIDTDGSLKAGGGKVALDSTGIGIETGTNAANTITWYHSDIDVAIVRNNYSSPESTFFAGAQTKGSSGETAQSRFLVSDGGGSAGAAVLLDTEYDTQSSSRIQLVTNPNSYDTPTTGIGIRVDSDANIQVGEGLYIGAIGTKPGSRTIEIADHGGTPATPSGGSLLYSSGGEMYAMDDGGADHLLTPHNFSLIPGGPSEKFAWAYYCEHREQGKAVNVDMMKLARLVEELSGEKLVFVRDLVDERLEVA